MKRKRTDDRQGSEPASAQVMSRLEREQMRLLTSHLPIALPGSLVVALLLVWFVGQSDAISAISWFSGVLVLVIARLVVIAQVARAASESKNHLLLKWLLLGGSLLSGLLWGMAGLLFFDHGNMPGFALLVIVLGGVVSGSLAPHSYYFPNYLLFAIPAILPLSLLLLAQNDDFYTMVSIPLLLFLLVNLLYSRQYERMVIHSIRLQFSNEDLVRQLEESNRRLHQYSYTDS
ncbi:MAG TPA: hypothetical protein EYP90_01190, partial [Chromatiaceae bacterium]|nr:hypothetical protein [Chromatiaceae bacterium]